MRPEMIRCLLLVLGLIAASAMPARAQSCTVTPPATFNLGTIDVLANTIVDVQTTISISCRAWVIGGGPAK